MKNRIRFYYNLNDFSLTMINKDIYYFKYQDIFYSFEKIENVDYLRSVLSILRSIPNSHYFRLVPNIYNDDFCIIDNQKYGLFMHNAFSFSLFNEIINLPALSYNMSNIRVYPWDFLWIKKINYYEYQVKHIFTVDTSSIINDCIYYYIGMAENAISYLKYNSAHFSSKLYLCHKRISMKDFFHPQNIIIDCYPRDVSEYIKYLFFSNTYQNFSYISFFRVLQFSFNDYILLYSRLLFPSYFFDVYDDIVNNHSDDVKLKSILLRVNEYNDYLVYIHSIICQFIEIPEVLWLKRKYL